MNVRPLVYLVIFCCSLACAARAQTGPTSEEFARNLKTCAGEQRVNLDANTLDSIGKLYAGEGSRQALKNPTDFLLLIPEDKRIDAFRLYADCITKIAPQLTTMPQSPLVPPGAALVTTTTYKVCTGEYERACQPHDVYLYCAQSVDAWAAQRCASYKLLRLNSYGGNRCGYSLDQVLCTGPR